MTPAVKRSTPSANAVRLRRARERRRSGLVSCRINVPIDRFLDSLVQSRRVTERQAQELRRSQVEAELERLVLDFVARWK